MKKKLLTLLGLTSLVLTSKSLCSASEILQTTDFKSGISLPWFISESLDRNSSSEVIDGNYVVHLEYPGTNTWDVAIRHKEFQILKNHTYKVNFKVSSTKNCKIYVKIGDTGEPYNEVWNNNWLPFSLTAGKPLEVSDVFTANVDCKTADFSFYVGGNLAASPPYDISFMSMSLFDNEYVTTPIPSSPSYDIRVNQLGYYTKGDKIAILKAKDSSQTNPVNWRLVDSNMKTVCSGTTKTPSFDHASGENIYTINFSEFKTTGKGYMLYSGNSLSLPFDIGTDMYSKMKYDALKYFYHERSGTEIKMPYCVESQWAREAGHSRDIAKCLSGHNYEGPSTIDATGGWYTAGTHTKYTLNAGLALWTLQNQYEFALKNGFSKDFDDKTLNIPESGNNIPDLLDEARWEMEWMLKMQIPEGYDRSGMVIHRIFDQEQVVLGLVGGSRPDIRYYYPPSTNATLNLAACAAQSARLWKDIDKEFSDRCLLAAESAWAAAKKNPINTPSYGSIPAGNIVTQDIDDEFYWAACELYLTTKKSTYLEEIKSSSFYCTVPNTLIGNIEQVSTPYYFSTMASLGTFSLALLAQDEFPKAIEGIENTADSFVNIRDAEGYRVTLSEKMKISSFYGDQELNGYAPFSNQMLLNNAILMAYAYDLKKDPKYLSTLRDSLDYLLGRNPNLKSYVTGYGERPAENPYHVFFARMANPDSPAAPSGFVVSGPSSLANDNWISASIPKDSASQKHYRDNIESWASNSVSVDLNAALAWVTAYSDAIGDVDYTPIVKPTPINSYLADINKDGVVNMSDIMLIAKVFNQTEKDSLYRKDCDITNDGVINMADVMFVAVNFGTVLSK